MKTLYDHDQMGWVILGFSVLPLLAIPMIYMALPRQFGSSIILGSVFAVLMLTNLMFYKGRIQLNEERVRFSFGPGLISKSIRLDEIDSMSSASLSIIDGYGIRVTRKGWLYNVSGSEAVEFRLKNGKYIRFGTDEPDRLIAAVGRALTNIKEAKA